MSLPTYFEQGILPTSTIVPTNDSLFIPYFTSLYEEISQAVNVKDNIFFPIVITSTATNIVNLANFGAFIVCVSGVDSTLPCGTWSLCKASATASGATGIVSLSSQAGTGDWAGNVLTITSTTTNFQIAHDRTGVSGNFNIKIIGTQ